MMSRGKFMALDALMRALKLRKPTSSKQQSRALIGPGTVIALQMLKPILRNDHRLAREGFKYFRLLILEFHNKNHFPIINFIFMK